VKLHNLATFRAIRQGFARRSRADKRKV